MSALPLLLYRGRLKAAVHGVFSESALELALGLGRIAGRTDFCPESLKAAGTDVPKCLLESWQTAAAREILLLSQFDPESAEKFLPEFGGLFPLGESQPDLNALHPFPTAVTIIPLDDPAAPAGRLAFLWVVQDPGNKLNAPPALEGAQGLIPGGYKVFIDAPARVTGNSWTLAGSLALRALRARSYDPTAGLTMALASRAILTGAVTGDLPGVQEVAPGNKFLLKIPRQLSRSWICPPQTLATAKAAGDCLDANEKNTLTADQVESAWRLATDQGTLSDETVHPWPQSAGCGPTTLHVFVSGVLQPAVLSIAFTRPARLVLWITNRMKPRAEELKALCLRLPELSGLTVEERSLSASGNIQILEEALAELRDIKEPQFFNITGGNLLMRLAVMHLARDLPQLTLIYRDADHPPHRPAFTAVTHAHGRASTRQIGLPEDLPAAVDYAGLCQPGTAWQTAAELAVFLEEPALPARPAMAWECYWVFAAVGLQSYILGSDKLREMSGATILIDSLATQLLPDALRQLGVAPGRYQIVSQAAGAARVLFAGDAEAAALHHVWPLLCARYAPGLRVAAWRERRQQGDTFSSVVRRAEAALAKERQIPARHLPELTPIMARNPRTGLAAVTLVDGTEPTDAEALAKTQFRYKSHRELPSGCRTIGMTSVEQMPPHFEALSDGGKDYLAIIHADGNGIGRLFMALSSLSPEPPEASLTEFQRSLSDGLQSACAAAAAAAVRTLRGEWPEWFPADKPWPVLPIVLAGDDLTLVLRARLAFPFLRAYLAAFEERTAELCADLRRSWPRLAGTLPAGLSAAAGVALVKSHYPWSAGYALAESLTRFAKQKTAPARLPDGRLPSSLAFHCVSASSAPTDYAEILETELAGTDSFIMSSQPYVCGIQAGSPLPSLRSLEQLSGALAAYPAGKRRQLLSLLLENPSGAAKHFERMTATAPDGGTALRAALRPLTGAADPLRTPDGRCPLGDALTHLWLNPPPDLP